MAKNQELFSARFGKRRTPQVDPEDKRCVIYTRVSSSQQEDNTSLSTQLQSCIQYSEKATLEVVECFGGTYESASSDERKEFQRMLGYVKSTRVAHILVYRYDRFSRTGPSGIYIADQLKSIGVRVVSITQPCDASTPTGAFNQNMQFLMSQYENEVRKERCGTGIVKHLENGYWIGYAPMGYTQIGFKKKQEYEINEKGRILKKAFEWKAAGVTNTEIQKRLRERGLKVYKQNLSRILRNPFYCGLVTNKTLQGRVVEGRQPALISKALFLKVQDVLDGVPTGFTHNQSDGHQVHVPLKGMLKCDYCGTNLTGYLVKKKGLYYYKFNTAGCKCNRSAKKVNEQFKSFLQGIALKPELAPLLKEIILDKMRDQVEDQAQRSKVLEKQLKEVTEKLENIEERFATGQIDLELYQRFAPKYKQEKEQTNAQLSIEGSSWIKRETWGAVKIKRRY